MQDVQFIEADLHQQSHAQATLDLLDGYARTSFGQGRPLDEGIRSGLIAKLQQHPTTRVFLAQSGDQYVGIAVCFVGFSTFQAKPLLNIHDIYVRENHQGQGIGRLLLEGVAQAAKASGYCKVTLEVMDGNPKASELYQRCGFELGEVGRDAHRFLIRKL